MSKNREKPSKISKNHEKRRKAVTKTIKNFLKNREKKSKMSKNLEKKQKNPKTG